MMNCSKGSNYNSKMFSSVDSGLYNITHCVSFLRLLLKLPQTWWFKTIEIYSFRVLEA